MRYRPYALLIMLLLTFGSSACPVCNSGRGKEVRRAIAETNLTTASLAIALPFLVVGGVAFAVHHGVPSRRSHDRRD